MGSMVGGAELDMAIGMGNLGSMMAVGIRVGGITLAMDRRMEMRSRIDEVGIDLWG